MELRENEITINCLSGEGQWTTSPKVIKPVIVAIHDTNIWFQNSYGWGFSIDKDMAVMLLKKILPAEELPMNINIHDNFLAERIGEVLTQAVKDAQTVG